MLDVNKQISIPLEEIEMSAMRAQGPGGQSVAKTSSAVHLRFDIKASSLPDEVKDVLLAMRDQRITDDGVVVIKAQQTRSQDMNRADALERLAELVRKAAFKPKPRKATKLSKAAKKKRVDQKTKHGALKKLRSKKISD